MLFSGGARDLEQRDLHIQDGAEEFSDFQCRFRRRPSDFVLLRKKLGGSTHGHNDEHPQAHHFLPVPATTPEPYRVSRIQPPTCAAQEKDGVPGPKHEVELEHDTAPEEQFI